MTMTFWNTKDMINNISNEWVVSKYITMFSSHDFEFNPTYLKGHWYSVKLIL